MCWLSLHPQDESLRSEGRVKLGQSCQLYLLVTDVQFVLSSCVQKQQQLLLIQSVETEPGLGLRPYTIPQGDQDYY